MGTSTLATHSSADDGSFTSDFSTVLKSSAATSASLKPAWRRYFPSSRSGFGTVDPNGYFAALRDRRLNFTVAAAQIEHLHRQAEEEAAVAFRRSQNRAHCSARKKHSHHEGKSGTELLNNDQTSNYLNSLPLTARSNVSNNFQTKECNNNRIEQHYNISFDNRENELPGAPAALETSFFDKQSLDFTRGQRLVLQHFPFMRGMKDLFAAQKQLAAPVINAKARETTHPSRPSIGFSRVQIVGSPTAVAKDSKFRRSSAIKERSALAWLAQERYCTHDSKKSVGQVMKPTSTRPNTFC